MKNLFSYNITTSKSNAEEFIIRKTTDETSAKLDEQSEQLLKAEKNAGIPLWLSVIMLLAFCFAIIVAGAFIDALIEIGAEKTLHNSRILLPIGGVCLVIAVVILVFKILRYKKTVATPAFQELMTNTEAINNKCYEELSVPKLADEINLFASFYKITKSGKQKNPYGKLNNVYDVKVFTENNCLCFADLYCVTAIPLSQINGIYTIKKRAHFLFWTKDEKINSPRYKPYKIRENTNFYYVKPYYSLRFTHSDEEYEIIIPPYELEIIEKYVNVPVF